MVSSVPTWHVSCVQKPRNMSQSLPTLRSKESKNRNYLVWQSIGSSCIHTLSSFRKYMTPLWRNFQHWFRLVGKCVGLFRSLSYLARFTCHRRRRSSRWRRTRPTCCTTRSRLPPPPSRVTERLREVKSRTIISCVEALTDRRGSRHEMKCEDRARLTAPTCFLIKSEEKDKRPSGVDKWLYGARRRTSSLLTLIYRVFGNSGPKVLAYFSKNILLRDFLSLWGAPQMWSIW